MGKQGKQSLHIRYNGSLHCQLEDALQAVIEPFGYEFQTSGYNLTTDTRDIFFEKEPTDE